MASAAELVRAALVAAEIAVYPGVQHQYDGVFQASVGTFPNEPDDIICVKDIGGMNFGRDQVDGSHDVHPGVSILVRSLKYDTAGDKMAEIVNYLAALTPGTKFKVRDKEMTALSVYMKGTPTYVGTEETRRHWWGVDYRVAMGQTSLGD